MEEREPDFEAAYEKTAAMMRRYLESLPEAEQREAVRRMLIWYQISRWLDAPRVYRNETHA